MIYYQMLNFSLMILHAFLSLKMKTLSAKNLNNDQAKISYWTFQWKINFNLDPAKQAQEVILSRKTKWMIPYRFSIKTLLWKIPKKIKRQYS